MKKAVPMILSEDNFKQIFAFAEQYSKLAKALYNAALSYPSGLYRVGQGR